MQRRADATCFICAVIVRIISFLRYVCVLLASARHAGQDGVWGEPTTFHVICIVIWWLRMPNAARASALCRRRVAANDSLSRIRRHATNKKQNWSAFRMARGASPFLQTNPRKAAYCRLSFNPLERQHKQQGKRAADATFS